MTERRINQRLPKSVLLYPRFPISMRVSDMASRFNAAAAGRPLGNLGINELEEKVYRWLLKHRGASASEAAQALSLAPRRAQHLLGSIEAKGLATHSPEHPRRYIPSSPDVAVEALILQRQKGLQDARLVARELQNDTVFYQRDKRERIVELITSREAEWQVLQQVQASAQKEIVALVRPPFRIDPMGMPVEEEYYEQRKAQARGVIYRSVIASDFFESPEAIESVRADIEAGEEARIISSLPLKVFIVDRRIALIPLDSKQDHGPVLMVRSSDLLDALYDLFEVLWERATPLSFSKQDELQLEKVKPRLNDGARELIALMATGLNDKTLASDLGLPKRTFARRMSELMRNLDAHTRFQAGWLAALQFSNRISDTSMEGFEEMVGSSVKGGVK